MAIIIGMIPKEFRSTQTSYYPTMYTPLIISSFRVFSLSLVLKRERLIIDIYSTLVIL